MDPDREGPGSMLTNPARLAGAAGIMAQMGMQQAMAEITDYLASCVDPVDEDDHGHGTHVASTIAAPINGIGIAGVAPKVKIVNLRAGQDSGFFFLQPSVDALTYAGNNGIDVVNMSYYVDPWLFNCADNPADSPEDQAEQRTIVTAMQRAPDYAHRRGSRWSPRPAMAPPTTRR